MKKIFICLFVVFLFVISNSMPLRYQKIYSEKYSKNEDLHLFKKMGKFNNYVSDELLKKCFEAKKIKYVLIEKYRMIGGIFDLISWIYFDEKYKIEEGDFLKMQRNLKDKSFILMFPITSEEFRVFSLLINKAVKYEFMRYFASYSFSSTSVENYMMMTYFDGEKQHTIYFSDPECSIKDVSKILNIELESAEYLMYAWRYGYLHGFIDYELISGDYKWILNDKKILKHLDEGIDKVLKEDSMKEENKSISIKKP